MLQHTGCCLVLPPPLFIKGKRCPTPMRILFIHNKYKYRGGEDATLNIERTLLSAKGHETDLLEFDNDNIDGLYSKITAGLAAIYNRRSAKLLQQKITIFK